MSAGDERLVGKVARGVSEPWTGDGRAAQGSILTVSAGVYGARPVTDETTIPTGFDPQAAALFEAIVEAAYLTATADGVLDDSEREAFPQVVIDACGAALPHTPLPTPPPTPRPQLHNQHPPHPI